MDEDFPTLIRPQNPLRIVKTYSKMDKMGSKSNIEQNPTPQHKDIPKPDLSGHTKPVSLTTLKAVTFLLNGTLKGKVCRYCLNITSHLSEVDEVFQVGNNGSLYKMTLKDMVATFHPFKVADDPDLPNKICESCIDKAISSYLFAQQCERAERALRNCFEDIYEKLIKLDSLDGPKKRGRQKLKPNYNKLYAENEKVIDYAEPLYHLINTCDVINETLNEFECYKCCEVLPNLESLLNHTKSHPKSMWFHCRLCGQSFPKIYQLKRHFRLGHPSQNTENKTYYVCNKCGTSSENYYKHLEHVEKHKFKNVLEHLVEKKMDRLCTICLNQGNDMTALDQTVCLHGGCKELAGEKPLYSILASTLPEMTTLDNVTGTKICKNCLDNAITSYIFINQSYFVRNRLNKCVSYMLDNLNKMGEPNRNICIEIGQSLIMTASPQFDGKLLDFDNIDENPNIEVLEDEFRLKYEEELETDTQPFTENELNDKHRSNINKVNKSSNIKTELQTNAVNGYVNEKSICNEYSKKSARREPKYTCCLCNKHFISDYFLKRHILKHIPIKVECDICDTQFQCKFYLHEHKKTVHLQKRTEFACCKDCGRYFKNEDRLQFHRKSHHNKFCQLCEKFFKSQRYFDSHMERHKYKIVMQMRKSRQNCSFCEKDCSSNNEFSLHVNKVHLQIKPFSCDMCEKQFYTEYNMRSHKKLHSVISKEKCRFCNKILPSRKQLVIHIRKHLGDKPFCCQICNESFYSQCKAKKHMKLSHGGQYCCKFCKIAFETKKDLEKHVGSAHNSWF